MRTLMFAAILSTLAACDKKSDDDPITPTPPLAPGALDPAFGTGGMIDSSFSTGHNEMVGAAISGGSLFAVGVDMSLGGADYRWRIEKRSAVDGQLVPGFGTAGVVLSNPSAADDLPYAVAVDEGAGTFYVVGVDSSIGSPNYQWRIEKRNLTTGALVAAFGTAGVVLSNPSTGDDAARAVTLDATGLYVGGVDRTLGATNAQWRLEKRDLATGALIGTFGTGGVILENLTAQDDTLYCLLQVGVYLFVGGDDNVPGNHRARVEKRLASDGSLVGAFGPVIAGTVVFDTVQNDTLNGIAFDGFSIYTSIISNLANLRVQKLDLNTGAVVPAFGAGGTLVLPFTPSAGSWAGMPAPFAISGTTLYIGGEEFGSNYRIRVDARNTTDGGLVSSFGTGGVVTSDPTPINDKPLHLLLEPAAIHILGHTETISQADFTWHFEKRVR